MTTINAPAIKVRFPPDLKNWIEQQAKANHRSLTGEINYRLELARNSSENGGLPPSADGMPATS